MTKEQVLTLLDDRTIFSPMLVAEVSEVIDSLSATEVTALGRVVEAARAASQQFGQASQSYLSCVEELEKIALRRVSDEGSRIMAEFEEQLKKSL